MKRSPSLKYLMQQRSRVRHPIYTYYYIIIINNIDKNNDVTSLPTLFSRTYYTHYVMLHIILLLLLFHARLLLRVFGRRPCSKSPKRLENLARAGVEDKNALVRFPRFTPPPSLTVPSGVRPSVDDYLPYALLQVLDAGAVRGQVALRLRAQLLLHPLFRPDFVATDAPASSVIVIVCPL